MTVRIHDSLIRRMNGNLVLRRSQAGSRWRFVGLLAAVLLGGSLGSLRAAGDLDPRLLGQWPERPVPPPRRVAMNGRYAVFGGAGTLQVVDLSDPLSPRITGTWGNVQDGWGDPTGIVVFGDRAVASLGDQGLAIINLADPAHPRWLGGAGTVGRAVAVAVDTTHAYVIEARAGRGDIGDPPGALAVFDLSDPAEPLRVGEYVLPRVGPGFVDPVGVAVSGSLACTVEWGWAETDSTDRSTLRVVDVSDPARPRELGTRQVVGRVGGVAMQDHRAVWVVTDVSGATRRTTFEVLDLTDPVHPTKLGSLPSTGDEVNDVAWSGNTVALAKLRLSSSSGVDFIDVSDPVAPRRVGTAPVARVAGADSTDAAYGVAFDGVIACVAARSSGLQLFDLATLTAPRRLAVLPPVQDVNDVAVSGNLAFVAGGEPGIVVLDARDPTAPRRLGGLAIGAYRLKAEGHYVHVAGNQGGYNIVDVSDPSKPRRAGGYRPSSAICDVALSEAGDFAYLADVEVGLHVMDVTNPATPRRRGGHTARYSGSFHAIAAAGTHVFLAEVQYSVGSYVGVVEVFDVSNPAAPEVVGAYETLGPAQGVAIVGQRAYVAEIWYEGGNGTPHGALEILDITDPTNPQRLGQYDCPARVGKVEVRDSLVYLSRDSDDRWGLINPHTLDILDVANPVIPRRVGGFAGQGSGSRAFTVAGNRLWVADRYILRAVDLAPAAAAKPSGLADTPGDAYGVALQGSHAYVADGAAGVQVFSLADPVRPRLVGNSVPSDVAWAVAVAGNRAVVAEGTAGLQVLDISDPADPVPLGGYDTPGEAVGVLLEGNLAYVADKAGGVQIVDIANAANPRRVGMHATTGLTTGVARLGDRLLVANRSAGLEILDVRDPVNPRRLGGFHRGGLILTAATAGNLAYVADGMEGFQVLDWTDPAQPVRLGVVPGRFLARGMLVSGRFVYVSDAHSGLRVFDVRDPARPRLLGGSSAVDAYALATDGSRVLVAGRVGGMVVFDAFRPPLWLEARTTPAPGGLAVRVDGPAGATVRLQRSGDLNAWEDWRPITLGEEPQEVVDESLGGVGPRFYRAVGP